MNGAQHLDGMTIDFRRADLDLAGERRVALHRSEDLIADYHYASEQIDGRHSGIRDLER